jgi:hypothetical protein
MLLEYHLLNDLNHSGLKYGSNDDFDKSLPYAGYVENDRLNLDRFECADHEKCLESLFIESDTTFVTNTFLAQYVASRIGKRANKNRLCYLVENIFSSNSIIIFLQGHPVTESFNIVIRHCIDAGHGDKYRSDLRFSLTLQNMKKLKESTAKPVVIHILFFSYSSESGVYGFGIRLCVECFSVRD